MRLWILGSLLLATACNRAASTTPPASAAAAPLQTDEQRTLYALGLVMGQRMGEFSLTAADLVIVQRGIHDQVLGTTPAVPLREWGPRIGELARTRQTARAAQEQTRGREFITREAQVAGTQRLPSGMLYRELRAGNGAQPAAQDTVRVHYRGTLLNGTEFDSSYANNNEPVEFPLGGVIPCWTEGVQRLHVGGKARLVCPADLAYGERGQRGIPPGATLVFEIELLGITTPPAPPAAPSNVSPALPTDAGAPGAHPG
jgi:FKBP-type peptidyl-prolyl cis-trans isomerase FkpA